MPLTVKNTSDMEAVWLATILYGPPKSGKTTFAAGLGKPLVVDFDDGLLSLRDHGVPFVQPRTWEEVLNLATELRNGKFDEKVDFNHVIWDSHSMFYGVVMEGVLRISKRPQPQLQDWGLANDRCKMVYDQLVKCRVERKFHFTVVCHEKVDKDDTTGRLVGGINATPALMAIVPAMFDEMYYLTTNVGTGPGGKTEVKRSVWTVQNGFFPAGTRSAGRLLPTEEANFFSIYNKIVGGKK
jgi:hypothetical protein